MDNNHILHQNMNNGEADDGVDETVIQDACDAINSMAQEAELRKAKVLQRMLDAYQNPDPELEAEAIAALQDLEGNPGEDRVEMLPPVEIGPAAAIRPSSWTGSGAGGSGKTKAAQSSSATALFSHLREWDERNRQEVRRHVMCNLEKEVGELVDRFGATSAVLYVVEVTEKGEALQPLIVNNCTHQGAENPVCISLEGFPTTDGPPRSIVAHVARTMRGYYTNDVENDPYYHRRRPGTQSQLTIPLLRKGAGKRSPNRLLGVLDFESCDKNGFTAAQLDDLQAASQGVVFQLIARAAAYNANLSVCPWHPDIHGWDLREISQQLCQTMAELTSRKGDSQWCIWYVDWAKQHMHVYATTGYDAEYTKRNVLSLHSRTGETAKGKPGAVAKGDPQSDPLFVRKGKAKRMGVSWYQMTPIHREGGGGSHAVATLNVNYFGDRSLVSRHSDEVLSELAGQYGKMITSYDLQRRELGSAYLKYKLATKAVADGYLFESIKRVFLEVFEAEGCHIFLRSARGDRLTCVATTGLIRSGAFPAVGQEENREEALPLSGIVFNLDGRHPNSIATYLATHPAACVRKNDVPDSNEAGMPGGFPEIIQEPYRDVFCPTDGDHRRVLGIAVTLPGEDGPPTKNHILGVVLVVRPEGSKPFTRCDEELIRRMAAECRESFLHRFAGSSGESSIAVGHRADARDEMTNAVARLFLRPYVGNSHLGPRQQMEVILQDLKTIFRDKGIISAGVLFRYRDEPHAAYKVYLSRSDLKDDPHKASDLSLVYGDDRLEWSNIQSRQKVVTFTKAGDGKITAGIRVPFRTWGAGQRLIQGVLSLDFRDPVQWGVNDVGIACYGAGKICAVFANRADRQTVSQFHDPVARLETLVTERMRPHWIDLVLKGNQPLHVLTASTPVEDVEWYPVSENRDEAALGVRKRADNLGWAIPLEVGPLLQGELRFGWTDRAAQAGSSPEKRSGMIGGLFNAWSLLAVSGEHRCSSEFFPDAPNAAITSWSPRFSLHGAG